MLCPCLRFQSQKNLTNRTLLCFKTLSGNDLQQRNKIFGIVGHKEPAWVVKLDMTKFYYSSVRLFTFWWTSRIDSEGEAKSHEDEFIQILSASEKSAAGFDILVDDVVIIMLNAVLTVVLHHSVCVWASEQSFGAGNHQHFHCSTICHCKKTEIFSSMSAGTMVPSVCFGQKAAYPFLQ